MDILVGRKAEIAQLSRYYKSGKPEFVAVYGRRRVGKTFLIDEVFRDSMAFHHTGLSPFDRKRKVTLKDQLQNFCFSLIRHGLDGIDAPQSWMEAFFLLERLLERQDNGSRQVVFIDELPWMDTPRSGFLTALEAFWNGWGNTRHNLCLIVCGSATSWMLDNLINNKGGLYGRLTGELRISPFTLQECEAFFQNRGINLSRFNIAQAYMILGGIPYYLDYFNPSLSLAQNVDALFFGPKAKLGQEFERLFHSVFERADDCMKIVRLLGRRHGGYNREEIAAQTGIRANGELSKMLKALVSSDFVMRYTPFGKSGREEYYKLSDCFCWFWIHFKERRHIVETDYWQHHLRESEIASWRGIAFEEVCWQHIRQIKAALQIGGVSSNESALIVRGEDEAEGMQLDLLIDRADDVINLCEMKFGMSDYVVTKSYADKLVRHKEELEKLKPGKAVHLTLVSAAPVRPNEYADTFVSKVDLDDLFHA